jgi:hypothetical protein
MKNIALFAVIVLTAGSFSATAQLIKTNKEKYYSFLTSHSELGNTGEKQDFGLKNLQHLIMS